MEVLLGSTVKVYRTGFFSRPSLKPQSAPRSSPILALDALCQAQGPTLGQGQGQGQGQDMVRS